MTGHDDSTINIVIAIIIIIIIIIIIKTMCVWSMSVVCWTPKFCCYLLVGYICLIKAFHFIYIWEVCLQCLDPVCWASGGASEWEFWYHWWLTGGDYEAVVLPEHQELAGFVPLLSIDYTPVYVAHGTDRVSTTELCILRSAHSRR